MIVSSHLRVLCMSDTLVEQTINKTMEIKIFIGVCHIFGPRISNVQPFSCFIFGCGFRYIVVRVNSGMSVCFTSDSDADAD
jgi:hypothetical protein